MRIAVIGAGCGGQAIAGYLASKGNNVTIYNRSVERLLPLLSKGEIKLQGEIETKGKLHKVTTNIDDAVKDSKLIMVATTATGHYDIAKNLAPYLKNGQTVVLNPGRTFGSLEFMNTLLEYGCEADVNVAEANTLIYATRKVEPGVSNILGIKNKIVFSVLPTKNTFYVQELMSEHYPQFQATDNFLTTSLGNIGAVFHPTITLLNKGKIKRGEEFEFYRDGATKGIVDYMQRVDDERRAIASQFGVEVPSLREWLCERYDLQEESLYDALHNNPGYAGLMAPGTMDTRYLTEDVPTGLVPLSELGKAVRVDTTRIDELIKMASEELGIDFMTEGRTLKRLGLNPMTIRQDLEKILGVASVPEYKRMSLVA